MTNLNNNKSKLIMNLIIYIILGDAIQCISMFAALMYCSEMLFKIQF